MTWDSDLVHMIENPKRAAILQSLHYLSLWQDGAGEPLCREVREIWRGVEQDSDGVEVITFKTREGSAFRFDRQVADWAGAQISICH